MTRVKLDRVEPLRGELSAFIDAARGGAGPVVSGVDGLAALRVARALVESGQTGAVVRLAGEREAPSVSNGATPPSAAVHPRSKRSSE
jgi:hypothetical protein